MGVRRHLNPEKREIIDLFERKIKPLVDKIVKPRIFDPIRYTLRIRSSPGGLSVPTYFVLKELGCDKKTRRIFSSIVEIASANSLLMDDIVDGDEQRSGVDSTWKKYGVDTAVISYSMMDDVLNNISSEIGVHEVFGESSTKTKLSWIEEKRINSKNPFSVSMKDLENLAMLKTSIGLGAMKGVKKLSGVGDDSIVRFAYNRGIAWQFNNDLRDIFPLEGEIGKMSDISNGYVTLPIFLSFHDKSIGKGKNLVRYFGRGKYNAIKFVQTLDSRKLRRASIENVSKYLDKSNFFLEEFCNKNQLGEKTHRKLSMFSAVKI